MHDPNFLGPQNSSLFLFPACSSNDNGEITGLGVTTAGEFRDYLLTQSHGQRTPQNCSE